MVELYDVKCPECREVILKCPAKVDQAVIDITVFHYAKCVLEMKE